jgi:hypothetical protein
MSFPGRVISIIDVPEMKKFELGFKYNYFLPNESTTNADSVNSIGPEAQSQYKKYNKLSAAGKPTNLINDKLGKIIPRYIILTFQPVYPSSMVDSTNFALKTSSESNNKGTDYKKFNKGIENISISQNRKIIHSETEFSNGAFSVFNFQDTGVDGKMYFLASGSISNRLNTYNKGIAKGIAEKLDSIQSTINNKSHTDKAKMLNELTSEEVVPDFIMDALNFAEAQSKKFFNDEQIKKRIVTRTEKYKEISFPTTINNKLIHKVLTSVKQDRLGLYHDELTTKFGKKSSVIERAESIESTSHNAYIPGAINENDYYSIMEPVPAERIGINPDSIDLANFTGIKKLQGYEIKKVRIEQDGNRVTQPAIYIENPEIGNYTDAKVMYGKTYEYTIRSIFSLTILADDPNNEKGTLQPATVLIASKPMVRRVKTIEERPPNPPINIKYFYDYEKNGLRLIWDMPTNTQRDIKRFQIFRRKSILDPFELIMEFNFDDKLPPKFSSGEAIHESLRVKTNDYVFTYLDREFNKKSKYIYAMCSIDAHGMTSNYSIQIETTFDKFKNVLVKKFISYAGAPKQYPNFVLQNTLVHNSIRDSNHSKLKVYFDPEYLSVYKENGATKDKYRLISTRDYGKYRLEFINIDLQKNTGIDIIIDSKELKDKIGLLDLDELKDL